MLYAFQSNFMHFARFHHRDLHFQLQLKHSYSKVRLWLWNEELKICLIEIIISSFVFLLFIRKKRVFDPFIQLNLIKQFQRLQRRMQQFAVCIIRCSYKSINFGFDRIWFKAWSFKDHHQSNKSYKEQLINYNNWIISLHKSPSKCHRSSLCKRAEYFQGVMKYLGAN